MSKLHFVFFITIFSSIYFGMHYFVFTRVANGLELLGSARTALRIFFIIAAFSFMLTEFLTHRGAPQWTKPLADFGYIWLGFLAMAFTVFLCAEILRIFLQTASFKYYSTVISLILVAVAGVYSVYNVSRGPIVKEISIHTNKIPENIKQFTVVQLSDMHIDMLTSTKWLRGIVEKTNAIKPDLIVITGDLIDSRICLKPEYCAALKSLNAKYGVYAVSGNHEFYVGMEKFIETAANTGITIIDGNKIDIAGIVDLVGIDDEVSARNAKAESAIKDILAKSPAADMNKFSILLAHRPDVFLASSRLGIDLTLAGHTHAGQIPPMDLLVYFAYKYPWGFFKRGDTYLYTTIGTGTWGPPMRLFSRSEIVKIVLER